MGKHGARDAAYIYLDTAELKLAIYPKQDQAILCADPKDADDIYTRLTVACKRAYVTNAAGSNVLDVLNTAVAEGIDLALLCFPTAMASAAEAQEIRCAMQAFAVTGNTLIIITNKLEDIIPACGRVLIYKEGVTLVQGPKKRVLSRENIDSLFGCACTMNEEGLWYKSTWLPEISSVHENPYDRKILPAKNKNSFSAEEHFFMSEALKEAELAARTGEVPIGAVVVYKGEIIARAHNSRELAHDPSGHAEFSAMVKAAKALDRWRLSGCVVYVTLEPCLMCAGLLVNARVDGCVFAAFDEKAGALGSLYKLNEDKRLNHHFYVKSGLMETESRELLQSFFKSKRS